MSNPCPEGNGTTIGTDQQFTLDCDTRLVGDTIGSQDADSFLQCVDLCSSFHPKCEGVVFNRRTCDFKAGVRRDRDSRRFDAAMAVFPSASSNCGQLGNSARSGRKRYNMFCGQIINGRDMVQTHAPTLLDCMGQCSFTDGCDAVSFDASMDQGFKNCYLKTGDGDGPLAQNGIDTAVVNNAAVADSDPGPEPEPESAAPVSVASPDPVPTTTPAVVVPAPATTLLPSVVSVAPVSIAPSPAPATTLVPFAPTTQSVADLTFSTLVPTVASVRTETIVSVITSVRLGSLTETISSTQTMTIPVFNPLTTLTPLDPGATALPQATESGPTSQAWIAAPVVGSVAAVTVVAVAFVLWGRRSKRRNNSSPFNGVFERLPFSRSRSAPGTPKSTSSRGGGQFWGNSWRVQRHKLSDAESDRSPQVSRSGPIKRPEMVSVASRGSAEAKVPGAATRPPHGSSMDGIPDFLRT